MAKMTRSKLKGIVKECLVEILAEGLSSDEPKSNKANSLQKSRRDEERRLAEHRKKFEYRVEDTVSSITDDPIMASIFKDTATTTLQEQHEKNGQPQGLVNPNSNGGVNLDGIFGGASENWSKLAFDSKTPGR